MTSTINGHSRADVRIPPQSFSEEQSVNGAIIMAPDETFARLGDDLQANHFSNPDQGRLFAVLRRLHGQGLPINEASLRDHLHGEIDLPFEELDHFLVGCVDRAASYSNLVPFARTIIEKAAQRRILYSATQLVKDIYDGRGDSSHITESLSLLVETLNSIHTPKPSLPLRVAGESIDENPKLHRAVIHGKLRIGEVMNVIAPPKFGKSWFAMYCGLSVCTQRPIFEEYHTSGGNVLMVDNELHSATFDSRLRQVSMAMELSVENYRGRLSNICLRGNLIDLPALCRELHKLRPGAFDLVILDALYRFLPVGSDENSNSHVTALFNELDRLAAYLSCAILLVHHSTKGSQTDRSVVDVGAGASAQARAADTHLIFRAHEADGAFVVDAAVRSWAPIKPYVVRFNHPLWSRDDALDPTHLKRPTNRRATGQTREEAKVDQVDKNTTKILDALRLYPEGETTRVLRGKTGLSGAKCQDIIDVLVADGIVEEYLTKKNRQAVTMYKLIAVGQAGQAGLSHLSRVVGQPPLIEAVSSPTTPTLEGLPEFETDGEYR